MIILTKSLQLLLDQAILAIYGLVSRMYLRYKGSRHTLVSTEPGTDALKRFAAIELSASVPHLLDDPDSPFYLNAVPSFLWEYVTDDMPFSPALDIIFPKQGICFSFTEPGATQYQVTPQDTVKTSAQYLDALGSSSILPGRDRMYLEDLFSKRLNFSHDTIPLLPVFVSYRDVLAAKHPESLALILNRAWQKTLSWALTQLPPIPDTSTLRPEEYELGTWISRRGYLEEAQKTALFPLASTFVP